MKKLSRVSAALLAAVLLAGCGSISSKDGGYYATESPIAEGAAYDTAAGAANSSIVPEELPDSTDETAQKIIYNADINMESTDFDAARDTLLAAYKDLTGKDGVVEATHGGLECGLLMEKIPGLDAVSMGPELHDVHSVRERLNVPSTERTYELVCELLRRSC